jgi:hypothetical protein
MIRSVDDDDENKSFMKLYIFNGKKMKKNLREYEYIRNQDQTGYSQYIICGMAFTQTR